MGNAMEFDGDGDYVDLGDDTFDDISEAYTISVWTYPKDFKYGSRVISLEGWIGTIYGYSFKWYYSVYNGTENIAINSDDDLN